MIAYIYLFWKAPPTSQISPEAFLFANVSNPKPVPWEIMMLLIILAIIPEKLAITGSDQPFGCNNLKQDY